MILSKMDGTLCRHVYIFAYSGMVVFRGHIVLIGWNDSIAGETTNQLRFCPSMATHFSVAVVLGGVIKVWGDGS